LDRRAAASPQRIEDAQRRSANMCATAPISIVRRLAARVDALRRLAKFDPSLTCGTKEGIVAHNEAGETFGCW
jgi:hypothetical protein